MFVQMLYQEIKILKQAGAELGQAQLKLELGFTSIKIFCIELKTKLEKVVTENSLIANYREHEFSMPRCNLSSSTTPPLLH